MRYLFSYTSGIPPNLTYHMNQRRHAGCLCIFGWGHLHFWTVMEIGRPREDLVVSCDLYTLAAAPSWLLRYSCSFFGGWRKYIVLLVFGSLVTISFCWSGLFFSRWLFSRDIPGVWLIPLPANICMVFVGRRGSSFTFSYILGGFHTHAFTDLPTLLFTTLPS